MAGEEERKVIIDEDWKAKVEREKEEALKTPSESEAKGAEPDEKDRPSRFEGLMSYVASHAMAAMGMFAPEDVQDVPVNLELARFLIDALGALREKTQGNLAAREQGNLKQIIADLQQAYVACSQAVQETALRGTPPKSDILRP